MADFGLSEDMDISKEYFRQTEDNIIKLPIKWMALESITDRKFSEKTDVVKIVISQCHAKLYIINFFILCVILFLEVVIWCDLLGGV